MPSATTVTRTYQGRICGVWLADERARGRGNKPANEAAPPSPPAEGLERLWAHHQLFQTATNYYTLALAALAVDGQGHVGGLRDRLQECWEDYPRDGVVRTGLRTDLAPFIGDQPSARDAMKAILADNPLSDEVRRAAVDLIVANLKGESAIQKYGRELWPRLCKPDFHGTYDLDKATKAAGLTRADELLHGDGAPADGPAVLVSKLQFDWFANTTSRTPYVGEKAKKRLREALAFLIENDEAMKPHEARLRSQIERLPDVVSIPAYAGGSINKAPLKHRFFAYLLASKVEASPTTVDALRRAPWPAKRGQRGGGVELEATCAAPGGDPIKLARGDRGFVFRAFTALRGWSGQNDPRPRWPEFDIAALKEALKTINQINQKQSERDEKLVSAKAIVAWLRDGRGDQATAFAGPEFADADGLPGTLRGDPRAENLRQLLEEDLAVANELTDGEPAPYRLGRRTLRGLSELAERWNRCCDKGATESETESDLIHECDEYQARHRDDAGSVALFRALARPEHWAIWRAPSEEERKQIVKQNWSEDVLEDFRLLHETEDEVERLSEPVRFTPAHADASPRPYMASDLTGKSRSELSQRGDKHVVTLDIAWKDPNGCWGKRHVGAAFTAPRVLRDGLVGETPCWLSPMLAGLGVRSEELDFAEAAAVQLMLDREHGKIRALVNLPVAVPVEQVRKKLGVAARWTGNQFCTMDGARLHLHWPETTGLSKMKPKADWWESASGFDVLGVDLGTRTAGAFARLKVRAESKLDSDRRWPLGKAGGKAWFASLDRRGLLRLPGEDPRIPRDGMMRPAGDARGRKATDEETRAALDFIADCPASGLDETVATLGRRTYPEQNDLLLVALRRSQSYLARCHRWNWMLGESGRREQARTEISQEGSHPPGWCALDDCALRPALACEEKNLRNLLPVLLVRLADRLAPQRKRGWEWAPLGDRGDRPCHILRTTERCPQPGRATVSGQRGLSMARIEQFEDLRRRAQSLNRALWQRPGEKPLSGHEMRNQPVPDPCPELLKKLERMKKQRVDQTAHLIVAEALGAELISSAKPGDREAADRHGAYRRRRTRDDKPVEPVGCVVMEDLGRYRTSQDRGPSENSRLMKWCHRAVLAKVKMLCEPLGIPVIEAGAAYSSRFCSRTGVAGFRAVEVTAGDRVRFPWSRALAAVEGEHSKPEDESVAAVFRQLDEDPSPQGKPPRTLLLPRRGGPVFVPMKDWAPDRHGIQQADINAAINIGLRGIAGPDARQVRVRLRLKRQDGAWQPRRENLLERAAAQLDLSHASGDLPPGGPGGFLSAFFDHGKIADFERLDVGEQRIASGKGLWGTVKRQCWDRIAEINAARVERWRKNSEI